ncbi:MAG TPA: N-acetyltransferase [Clostridium sp.]|nr:N-acetyltransferase [Clostridium sp.]
MLEVKNVSSKLEEYKKVFQMYEEYFPENERLPLWFLRIMSKRRNVEFLAFYDNKILCGFTYLVHYKSTTFVYYLAVNKDVRSNGYGSKILSWIADSNKSNTIVLVIEEVDPKYDNYEERLNRIKFYKKNGFVNAGYKLIDKDGIYDFLYKGSDFSKSECEEMFKNFFLGFATKKIG